jgi:hypothetical protein
VSVCVCVCVRVREEVRERKVLAWCDVTPPRAVVFSSTRARCNCITRAAVGAHAHGGQVWDTCATCRAFVGVHTKPI